jgi:hypothetical protein
MQGKLGQIVEFIPAKPDNLPNGMTSAPAMIIQVFPNNICNVLIFVADDPATRFVWAVSYKDNVKEGVRYWKELE